MDTASSAGTGYFNELDGGGAGEHLPEKLCAISALVWGVQGTLYQALGAYLVHGTGLKRHDICQDNSVKCLLHARQYILQMLTETTLD